MDKKFCLGALLIGSASCLFSFTATFTESDTAYDWSDASIWDILPDANGQVYIEGGGTTGSSLNIDGLDLSAYGLKTHLNNAVLNITNGAKYYVWEGGDLSLSENITLELLGNSRFNMGDSTLIMGNFCSFVGGGSSELSFVNSTIESVYAAMIFKDQAKANFDNTIYQKVIWSDIAFADSSQLNLKNGSQFGFTGIWEDNGVPNGEVVFRGNSQLNILSGASFSTVNNIAINLEDNARINLDGLGSSIGVSGGIVTRTSEDGALANAKINVTNGASFSGTVELTGTSSLNFTSTAADENQTTGTLSGISLVDSTSVNISGAQTVLTANGTYIGTEGTSINISDGAVVSSGEIASLVLGGKLLTTVSNGARFNMGHNEVLHIQDDAKLVIDSAYLGFYNFPIITASGGELTFQNGGTLAGYDTTSTAGVFAHFNFSGNSKLTMRDTSISVGVVGNLPTNTFSGTSAWTLDNATFRDNGFGTYTNGLQFSGSASLVLKNASSFTWKSLEGATVSAIDSAKIDISGESSLTAYELSVGGASGSSSLTLRGDGNSVLVTSLFSLIGASGTSFANQQGGKLAFVANEYGISSLDVMEVAEFSGLIELDFSKFSEEGTFEFLLISSASEWDASAYVSNSEGESDLVNVIKANSGDSWVLDFDGTSLVFTYTHVVPEPATWAAIFGALALGLALLRRRAGRN